MLIKNKKNMNFFNNQLQEPLELTMKFFFKKDILINCNGYLKTVAITTLHLFFFATVVLK